MNSHHEQQAADRGGDAGANRLGAERRTDRALFEIRERRRQRARAQHQREVGGFLVGEAALDDAFVVDAAVDVRRRVDAVVEHDRQLAVDVGRGEVAEPRRAVAVEREADRRTVVLVERRPRVAQVAAGDGRNTADDVIDRRRPIALGAAVAVTRQDLQIRRQVVGVGLTRLRLVAERALLDQLQLEHAPST